jgi:hypothetical protein
VPFFFLPIFFLGKQKENGLYDEVLAEHRGETHQLDLTISRPYFIVDLSSLSNRGAP